jgi:pilus assembly protein Flp/PilA
MIVRRLLKLIRDEDGPTAVEYAVVLALVLVAVIQAITAVGSSTSGIMANDTDKISTAVASAINGS